MSKVRKLPGVDDRVETGPVQFGDDWPGIFIRGDNAMHYALALSSLLKNDGDPIAEMVVEGLMHTLMSSRVHHNREPDFVEITNDLNTCPNCGGPADNGHDRSYPPAPYFCTKCTQSR